MVLSTLQKHYILKGKCLILMRKKSTIKLGGKRHQKDKWCHFMSSNWPNLAPKQGEKREKDKWFLFRACTGGGVFIRGWRRGEGERRQGDVCKDGGG